MILFSLGGPNNMLQYTDNVKVERSIAGILERG
jgi:hypothetical protein